MHHDKGEVDFIAAAKGLAVLFAANIEIRAQLFFSMVDESGDGKIDRKEMMKFLTFINESNALGHSADEVKALNEEIFTVSKIKIILIILKNKNEYINQNISQFYSVFKQIVKKDKQICSGNIQLYI